MRDCSITTKAKINIFNKFFSTQASIWHCSVQNDDLGLWGKHVMTSPESPNCTFLDFTALCTIWSGSLDDPNCQFQLGRVSCYSISERKILAKLSFMDNISPIFPFFPPMKLTYFYYLHSFLEKYFHQHAGHRTDFDRPQEIESTLSLSSIPTTI